MFVAIGVGDTFAAIRLALDVISRAHCSVEGRTAAQLHAWLNAYTYVGYEGDRAVTAAAAIVNEGCLFLALVATRPEARGKGYAEAVVRQALQAGHEATGLARTILHATDAGFPVYKRVGYYKTGSILAYKLASPANS